MRRVNAIRYRLAKLLGDGRRVLNILFFLVIIAMPGTAGKPDAVAANATPFETISGYYAGPGVICPLFKLDGGETISLSGDYPELAAGQHFVLSGRWAEKSKCMQGREFHVFKQGE